MLLKNFYTLGDSSESENLFTTEIIIDNSHDIYKGHFPGRPVTPGVILMQLFKEEAQRRTNRSLALEKAQNIKFMAVVNPDLCNSLILETQIQEEQEGIRVKGVAKQKEAIVLKFNALYRII